MNELKPIVTLEPCEVSVMKLHAKYVQIYQDLVGNQTKKVDATRSDLEINIIGYVVEYAICKYLGIPFEGDPARKRDEGFDFHYKGYTWEVKGVTRPSGDFYVRYRPTYFRAQGGVLAHLLHGRLDKVQLLGWTSREEFLKNNTEKDYNNYGKPCFAMEQNQLYDIPSLLTLAEA